MSENLESLFYHIFGPKVPSVALGEHRFRPSVDVFETEDEVVIKMELPGLTREDFSVELEKSVLHIRGCRLDHDRPKAQRYHQMEISYGPFEKVIYLPEGISAQDMSARLKDGLLTISVNKRVRASEPRSLSIKIEQG